MATISRRRANAIRKNARVMNTRDFHLVDMPGRESHDGAAVEMVVELASVVVDKMKARLVNNESVSGEFEVLSLLVEFQKKKEESFWNRLLSWTKSWLPFLVKLFAPLVVKRL